MYVTCVNTKKSSDHIWRMELKIRMLLQFCSWEKEQRTYMKEQNIVKNSSYFKLHTIKEKKMLIYW